MENTNPESELESFRKKWQEEVSRRSKVKDRYQAGPSSGPLKGASGGKNTSIAPPSASDHAPNDYNHADTFEGYSLHDLENKEDALKLGASSGSRAGALGSEPKSALDHYEKAVEKESIGNLGDSISLYRKAFKLDDGVHEAYKQKHFAASWKKTTPTTAAASTTTATRSQSAAAQPSSVEELIESFSNLSIPPAEPASSLSQPPPCPISEVPLELLEAIFDAAVTQDPASTARLATVCKRLAYLITTSDGIWRKLLWSRVHGIGAMPYRYICDLKGLPVLDPFPCHLSSTADLTPSVFPDYRTQYRHRPRIRFGGCYISTVNYTRPGGHSLSHYGEDGRPSRHAWSAASPVHIVTYYRYLRFYRDGTVISLLTTSEPGDVVHFLFKEYVPEQPTLKPGGRAAHRQRHTQHDHTGSSTSSGPSAHGVSGALPQHVMKEALLGRWRLSGPASGPSPRLDSDDGDDSSDAASKRPGEYAKEPLSPDATPAGSEAEPAEEEGTLHVETQGVVPKYMWKMAFALGSSGRRDGAGPRNNKLSWKGFWSYNWLTDDWGEFGLKNDRPFYWSRVKSYGVGE